MTDVHLEPIEREDAISTLESLRLRIALRVDFDDVRRVTDSSLRQPYSTSTPRPLHDAFTITGMRLLAPAVLLLTCSGAAQPVLEPFVPIAVASRGLDENSLATVRSLRFNSLTTTLEWAEAEPSAGTYRFDALKSTLIRAQQAHLKVIVRMAMDVPPRWAGAADREHQARFIVAASAAVAGSPAFYAFDFIGARSTDEFRSKADAALPRASILRGALVEIPVSSATTAAEIRLQSWTALASGARAFEYPATILEGSGALAAAAGVFADRVAGNAALFAPLRPRAPRASGQAPDVRIDPSTSQVAAHLLESADALVLIVANHADALRAVTLTFGPDLPEAIWQNMETGGAVNFVAGSEGPTYTRTFTPHDVLVLMIRKKLR